MGAAGTGRREVILAVGAYDDGCMRYILLPSLFILFFYSCSFEAKMADRFEL
jgi:hypothetical protein